MSKYSMDDIQRMIIDICEEEYGPANKDKYFIVKDADENEVRCNILEKLEDEEIKKMKYLDAAVYVMQVEKDVFISVV